MTFFKEMISTQTNLSTSVDKESCKQAMLKVKQILESSDHLVESFPTF